jgi:membrane protein DedA with SNARE-associated domain
LLDGLLGLHGMIVYVIVGLLVFAEDALLVGFVVPGETAAILGGVAASRGHVHALPLTVVVVVAAILGDSTGYLIGTKGGRRFREWRLVRRQRARIERAEQFLRRRRAWAVFLGRFVAFLRAFIPFLAGSGRMRYGRFLLGNVSGAIVWGVGSVLVGYLAGNSYQAVVHLVGPVGAGIAVLVVVVAVIVIRIRARVRSTGSTGSSGSSVQRAGSPTQRRGIQG